jgi:hypothetical protein
LIEEVRSWKWKRDEDYDAAAEQEEKGKEIPLIEWV